MISGEDVSRSEPTDNEYVSFESIAASGKEPFLRINISTPSGTSTIKGMKISGVSLG